MYSRDIQAPVSSPIVNGKPLAGTWTRAFKKVDLLEITRPFSIAYPRWMLNFRVKEWQSFIIQNDEVHFETFIANLKFFRFIELTFMIKPQKKGEEKGIEPVHYLYCFPLSFWELPKSLGNNWLNAWVPSYSLWAHYWLDASIIKLNFNMEAGIGSPEINAMFEFSSDPRKWTPMANNTLLSEDRCLYTLKMLSPVRGTLKYGDKNTYEFSFENTMGLFRDYKGYFPYITRSSWVSAFGFDKEGRRIGFSMGEIETKVISKDNENVLWVDGAITPLPSVRITQAGDIEDEWVIEDVEGMVDLVFTPKKQLSRSAFNLIFCASELYNPVGTFKGFILTKDGERININKLPGCAERLFLRL